MNVAKSDTQFIDKGRVRGAKMPIQGVSGGSIGQDNTDMATVAIVANQDI